MRTAISTGPFSKRQVRAARFLSKHHTASQNPKLALMTDTTPWYCGTCQKKNSYRAEFCDQCGASWMWSSHSSSFLGQWALARCSKDSTAEKPIPFQRKREGTATRTKWQRKEQRKRKNRRVPWSCRHYTMAIVFISVAVFGCDLTGNGAEGATDPCSQAGRRSHLGTPSPSTQPWTRDNSRGGIVPCKVPWKWSTGDQAGESTVGSFGKGRRQVESRAFPIGHPMAKVPEEGRGRVHAVEAKVLGKTKTAARCFGAGGRRVQCSAASTARGSSSNGDTTRRRCCAAQTQRGYRSRTAVGRNRNSTETEAGSCRCGGGSSHEEVEVPDQNPGLSQCHEQDGFLIGRHGSCHNVHAKRPRFFCLVEAAIIDDDSAPIEVGNTPTTWWDLASPLAAQTIPSPSMPPHCKHEYGPRQAEYVAQLMRFEVETDQFPEAFDDCLWDETLTSLQHLDRIEQMEMFQATFSGHQHKDVVRQLEGSTLWTLLALGEDLSSSGEY